MSTEYVDTEINNATYFVLLLLPTLACFFLSIAQPKIERYVSWMEIEFLTAIIFFAIFINIVCYESYHIVESGHHFQKFNRHFILTSQRLLFYLGLIICMFIEKFLIKFTFDALSDKTVMKVKADETKTIVTMNTYDDDSSTIALHQESEPDSQRENDDNDLQGDHYSVQTLSKEKNVSGKSSSQYRSTSVFSSGGHDSSINDIEMQDNPRRGKIIQLDRESLKTVVDGDYTYNSVISGISNIDSSKNYSRQNLQLYCTRRYNHRMLMCILTLISISLFLLTTDIDQKITNDYYTFSRVFVFVFSKMFIIFCTMHTMIDLGINNYVYIFACFCFPITISMNVYFRKRNRSPEIFYHISFLQMFLSGIILYLAVSNYQYSKTIMGDKRNVILAIFTILFSFVMTVAL